MEIQKQLENTKELVLSFISICQNEKVIDPFYLYVDILAENLLIDFNQRFTIFRTLVHYEHNVSIMQYLKLTLATNSMT